MHFKQIPTNFFTSSLILHSISWSFAWFVNIEYNLVWVYVGILKFKRITIFCISQIASTETTTRIIKWLEPNNEVVFGLQPTINWVKPNSIHISYGISQNIVSIFYKLVDLKVINSIVPCQCSVYRCQSSLIVKKLNKIPKFN